MKIFLCVKKKEKKICYVGGNENNIYVLIYFKLERMSIVFRGKVYSRM